MQTGGSGKPDGVPASSVPLKDIKSDTPDAAGRQNSREVKVKDAPLTASSMDDAPKPFILDREEESKRLNLQRQRNIQAV